MSLAMSGPSPDLYPYWAFLEMRMRKGRTEVSGRTPIVRELLRFDPASFYSRVMFMEINSAAAIHSIVR